MPNPIIFLDIDGVLLPGRWIKWRPPNAQRFDYRCCCNLANIVLQTGARVVLSSTWRTLVGCIKMEKLIRDCGGHGVRIIAKTPVWGDLNTGYPTRGEEITRWLDVTRKPLTVLAIDDEDDGITAAGIPLLLTTFHHGLTAKLADEAIRRLTAPASDTAPPHPPPARASGTPRKAARSRPG
jgi:hypothetical protein